MYVYIYICQRYDFSQSLKRAIEASGPRRLGIQVFLHFISFHIQLTNNWIVLYVYIYIYVPGSGPPPSPPPWSWFSLPPCGCGCCRYCMVAPPPLWMWVPPVDVSPVRSVWFAPLPLWMWVLFATYTK